MRSVRDEQVLGAVDDVRIADAAFVGAAGDVLSALRRELGDEEAVRRVLADGWSNGYLYFAEPTP